MLGEEKSLNGNIDLELCDAAYLLGPGFLSFLN